MQCSLSWCSLHTIAGKRIALGWYTALEDAASIYSIHRWWPSGAINCLHVLLAKSPTGCSWKKDAVWTGSTWSDPYALLIWPPILPKANCSTSHVNCGPSFLSTSCCFTFVKLQWQWRKSQPFFVHCCHCFTNVKQQAFPPPAMGHPLWPPLWTLHNGPLAYHPNRMERRKILCKPLSELFAS